MKLTVKYQHRGCPPLLFLEVKPSLPAPIWKVHTAPDDCVDTLRMPKIAQTNREGAEGYHIHRVENVIIQT